MRLRRFFPLVIVALQLSASAAPWRGAPAISAGQLGRSERKFHRLGFLSAGTPLTRATIRQNAAPPELVARLNTRAVSLVFSFSGFTPAQTADLQTYLVTALPIMEQVYGLPAPAQRGRTVTVDTDAGPGDGLYEPPATGSTGGGKIHLLPVSTLDGYTSNQAKVINRYNLTRLVLFAFHGAQIFGSDPWEIGFADAVALISTFEFNGRPASFNPADLGVYLLPVYDLFNRPDLGNIYHFSATTSPNLGYYRGGMAQAAWLKVWVENANFFKNFNAAYYLQAGTGTALAKDVAALKTIAAAQLPQGVEGLGFADWYRRQHVLDVAIRTGEKLWLGLLPLPNLTSGDTRSVFFGVAQRFKTITNGDERPLTGTATVAAFNETGTDITAKSAELAADATLVFNAEGEAEFNGQNVPSNTLPVIGFSNVGPALPNQSRVTLRVRSDSSEAEAYFPYNVAGTEAALNGFYGATLGGESGTVAVSFFGGNGSATLARGAFGTRTAYPSGPGVKCAFTVTPTGGAPLNFIRNGAWSITGSTPQALAVLLEARPATQTANFTLKLANGNLLRMFSVPLYPEKSDDAVALGAEPLTLFLARYRPTLGSAFTGTQKFGFGSSRYDIYPANPPLAPGRGYWTRIQQETSYAVRGAAPPSVPFEVPLNGGWNQIGAPFARRFPLQFIKVRRLGEPTKSWNDAVTAGWLTPGVWRWQPAGGFDRMDSGLATRRFLAPFEGYYIFCPLERGVALIFDPAAPTAGSGDEPPIAGAWLMNLKAATNKGYDDDNSFGAVTISGANLPAPAAKPPMAARRVTLSFASSGSATWDGTKAGSQSGWADSFLPIGAPLRWNFTVDGAGNGEVVTLTWPGGQTLPADLVLTLVDDLTGARVTMSGPGAVASWKFPFGGVSRGLRIEGR